MANYNFNAKARNVTPQSAPIPGRESEMTKNFGGGYAFKATELPALSAKLKEPIESFFK